LKLKDRVEYDKEGNITVSVMPQELGSLTARGKPSVHSKASAREVQRFFSLFPRDD
jgi:hypothetical protein